MRSDSPPQPAASDINNKNEEFWQTYKAGEPK